MLNVGGRLLKSALDQHDTLRLFTSENLDCPRWQAVLSTFTLLLSALLVQIWFFSSKATTCCAEARPPRNSCPCRTLPRCSPYRSFTALVRGP